MHIDHLYLVANEIQVYASLLLKFYNQALEERLAQFGINITGLQYGILRMLQFEILTISQISQRMGIDMSTLVRSVDSLEKKELAKRGTDPHDRRRNPISITEKGRHLLVAVPLVCAEDLPFQALQSMGVEAAVQLRDLLREYLANTAEGKWVIELMQKGFDSP